MDVNQCSTLLPLLQYPPLFISSLLYCLLPFNLQLTSQPLRFAPALFKERSSLGSQSCDLALNGGALLTQTIVLQVLTFATVKHR